MKTTVLSKRYLLKPVLCVAVTAFGVLAHGQSGSNNLANGLRFDNYQLISGTNLQAGAEYLFSNVDTNTDAIVKIDSLVNGAKVNKIDDNSNGTGYKDAFQPAVQSGGVIGYSYAVFSVKFYAKGTTNPVTLQNVNATAVDVDGNNTLKEYARVNVGNGGTTSYMATTPDISILQILSGNYSVLNILGIERNGIDTLSYNNMFTASNTNIAGFTVSYGTFTTVPSTTVRQFSLYMKGFYYPGNTLPVKLASFTATLNNSKKVDLKWTTASEMNVSHFMIERSTDGSNFSEAGMVFAYGNSTEAKNYSFSDNISSIQSDVIYYRLRSVDVDGKFEYSETRIIRLSKQSQTNITILTYPNPATNELRITVPANWQNKKIVYEMFSINGQTASRKEAANASQTETLNLANLAAGIYMIKVSCNGETAQQKIIKR